MEQYAKFQKGQFSTTFFEGDKPLIPTDCQAEIQELRHKLKRLQSLKREEPPLDQQDEKQLNRVLYVRPLPL